MVFKSHFGSGTFVLKICEIQYIKCIETRAAFAEVAMGEEGFPGALPTWLLLEGHLLFLGTPKTLHSTLQKLVWGRGSQEGEI